MEAAPRAAGEKAVAMVVVMAAATVGRMAVEMVEEVMEGVEVMALAAWELAAAAQLGWAAAVEAEVARLEVPVEASTARVGQVMVAVAGGDLERAVARPAAAARAAETVGVTAGEAKAAVARVAARVVVAREVAVGAGAKALEAVVTALEVLGWAEVEEAAQAATAAKAVALLAGMAVEAQE